VQGGRGVGARANSDEPVAFGAQATCAIIIDRAGMAALRLRCIGNSVLGDKSNLQHVGTLLSHTLAAILRTQFCVRLRCASGYMCTLQVYMQVWSG
jgi:hypothetical protein